MSRYKKLTTVCCVAVLTLGLAACGGGGGGTASTGTPPVAMPDGNGTDGKMAASSALEEAVELGGRLADVDVATLQKGAIANAGKLTARSVMGDSAMAAANAQAVLDADKAIRDAVTNAEDVITDATVAKEAAEAIEDATEKAAVMQLLDNAIEGAEAIKAAAQVHIVEVATIDNDMVDTLGEAVAAVTGGAEAGPQKTAANAGEAVAAQVTAALGMIAVGVDNTDTPMGAIRNDSSDIEAMTWEQIMAGYNRTVMDVRRFENSTISEVKAASADGRKVSDFLAEDETAPTVGDHADGIFFSSTRRGIDGTVFCGGTDCKVDDDDVMTGSWYFTPDLLTALYVAGEGDAYMIATMYARYGYWLTYNTDGDASGVSTYAAVGNTNTNTENMNLAGEGDPAADVTATYTGDAVGISVRDKASGQFTASVNLTAKFGATPTLRGNITNFDGGATNPNWNVTLQEKGLGTAGSFTDGVTNSASGAGDPGVWSATAYGPMQTPMDTNTEPDTPAVNHRPEGFFGRFDANFGDGAAAGAYTTRK